MLREESGENRRHWTLDGRPKPPESPRSWKEVIRENYVKSKPLAKIDSKERETQLV